MPETEVDRMCEDISELQTKEDIRKAQVLREHWKDLAPSQVEKNEPIFIYQDKEQSAKTRFVLRSPIEHKTLCAVERKRNENGDPYNFHAYFMHKTQPTQSLNVMEDYHVKCNSFWMTTHYENPATTLRDTFADGRWNKFMKFFNTQRKLKVFGNFQIIAQDGDVQNLFIVQHVFDEKTVDGVTEKTFDGIQFSMRTENGGGCGTRIAMTLKADSSCSSASNLLRILELFIKDNLCDINDRPEPGNERCTMSEQLTIIKMFKQARNTIADVLDMCDVNGLKTMEEYFL